MATEGPLLRDGGQVTAAVDLSATANQYKAVKITAGRQVNLANTGGEAIYGILQNLPAANQAADVALNGVSKAVCGGTVSAGDKLMTDTLARLITATSTNFGVALAVEAGSANQIITVALVQSGKQ